MHVWLLTHTSLIISIMACIHSTTSSLLFLSFYASTNMYVLCIPNRHQAIPFYFPILKELTSTVFVAHSSRHNLNNHPPSRSTSFPLVLSCGPSTLFSNCLRLPAALLVPPAVNPPPSGTFVLPPHGIHVLHECNDPVEVRGSPGWYCCWWGNSSARWTSICSAVGEGGEFVLLGCELFSLYPSAAVAVRTPRWLVDVCGLAGSLTRAEGFDLATDGV